MKPPPWFEGPAFRPVEFHCGSRLNFHTPTGCAVAPGSRVWYAGRLRAVSRFYDSGAPCYAGAWSGSIRIGGRTVRGRVYVSPDYGNETATLRFSPDASKRDQ